MVVVVFRSRIKPGIEKEIEETDGRLAALAATMPGLSRIANTHPPMARGSAS